MSSQTPHVSTVNGADITMPTISNSDSVAAPSQAENGTATTSDTTATATKTTTTPSAKVDPENPNAERAKKPASKKDRPQPQHSTTEQNIAEAGAGVKLTGAQLKKQKAAEKAARRAEKVAVKGEQAQIEQQQQQQRPQTQQRRSSQSHGKDSLQQGQQSKHQRKPSNQPEPGVVRIPIRPAGQMATTTAQVAAKPAEKKVPMVSHLYTTARPASLLSASREIHPAVLTLALHYRSLTLAGSTARTIALLVALKRVIRAYITPPNTALSRHLTTHLSHQISFITAARPLSIPQGNAIRWLKKLISALDPDLDDNDAKNFICNEIDEFLHVRFILASQVIADEAATRITAGDTILVFGKSSVVEKLLLRAAQDKTFKVIVVDSRPFFEGRNLTKSLLRAGMRQGGDFPDHTVVYSLLSGLADVFSQHTVTKCFLGASAMLGNGGLYSRAGTAMVAMMAKQHNVPVVVLCESIKFTGKMAVDSLNMNELGDVEALVQKTPDPVVMVDVPKEEPKKTNKKKDEDKDETVDATPKSALEGWKDQTGLYLLNMMYDVTPKDFVDMVVCELGTLPPAAVPVVKGDSDEA